MMCMFTDKTVSLKFAVIWSISFGFPADESLDKSRHSICKIVREKRQFKNDESNATKILKLGEKIQIIPNRRK